MMNKKCVIKNLDKNLDRKKTGLDIFRHSVCMVCYGVLWCVRYNNNI